MTARLVLAGLLLLAGLGLLAGPAAAACQRPISVFARLVVLRDGRPPAAGGQAAAPAAAPAAARGPIDVVLSVKQSDYVAFPLHVAAGWALGGAGCAPEAVRDQWRKAAMHAWAPFAAEIAADGLRRTAEPGANLPALVARDAGEMPWFADNLARVRRALGAS